MNGETTTPENENNASQQQPVTQADPNLVAELVMARLLQAGNVGNQTQQESVPLSKRTAQTLKEKNFHPDFIEGIQDALDNVDRRIEEAVNKAVSAHTGKNREERAVDIIRGVIDEYADADPAIAYGADAIYNKAVQKFLHDPSFAAERAKFGAGQIDRSVFSKLAKAEVLQFYKHIGKEGPPSKGVAMRPNAASAAVSTPPPADPSPTTLSGLARERYESFYQLAIRSGKTAEEAKSGAMQSAKRFMK